MRILARSVRYGPRLSYSVFARQRRIVDRLRTARDAIMPLSALIAFPRPCSGCREPRRLQVLRRSWAVARAMRARSSVDSQGRSERSDASDDSLEFQATYRVGGRLNPVLPHHRTYGIPKVPSWQSAGAAALNLAGCAAMSRRPGGRCRSPSGRRRSSPACGAIFPTRERHAKGPRLVVIRHGDSRGASQTGWASLVVLDYVPRRRDEDDDGLARRRSQGRLHREKSGAKCRGMLRRAVHGERGNSVNQRFVKIFHAHVAPQVL
jgi:hypothetical protein